MLSLKSRSAPIKPKALADIDPSIAKLREQLRANDARTVALAAELDQLRPVLLVAATPGRAAVHAGVAAGLGAFASLAEPSAAVRGGPEPHLRDREIGEETAALRQASDLLRVELRDHSARASIVLCAATRGEYEALCAAALDAAVVLWRALAGCEGFLDRFAADGASPAALDVLPWHRAREGVDALLRECRARGQRLPIDLPGFRV
jgi:hypothetical protein